MQSNNMYNENLDDYVCDWCGHCGKLFDYGPELCAECSVLYNEDAEGRTKNNKPSAIEKLQGLADTGIDTWDEYYE